MVEYGSGPRRWPHRRVGAIVAAVHLYPRHKVKVASDVLSLATGIAVQIKSEADPAHDSLLEVIRVPVVQVVMVEGKQRGEREASTHL